MLSQLRDAVSDRTHCRRERRQLLSCCVNGRDLGGDSVALLAVLLCAVAMEGN